MVAATRPFTIHGINHIGLAAKDPEKTRWFFSQVLGLPYFGEELVAEQLTTTQMYGSQCQQTPATPGRLEVLIPTSEESAIAKFQAKKGSGLHHLALTVDDVVAAIRFLQDKGVKMIDAIPRNGCHHTRIAFIHPESTGGLLVELVQEVKS